METVVVIVAALTCAGCGSAGKVASTNQEKPAQVVHIPGSNVSKVILTPRAVERIEIKTEPARTVSDPAGIRTVVPLSALIYDGNGEVWVFTLVDPMTYIRQKVTVARISGNDAVLQSGPPPGTVVVTIGAVELLGAEYGVEGD
jgi:hypothetical protein